MSALELAPLREPVPIEPSGINILRDLSLVSATTEKGTGVFERLSDDMRISRYDGSRANRWVNHGSLVEVQQVWREVLNDFAYINQAYLKDKDPKETTVRGLREMAEIATLIPLFTFVKGENPIPRNGDLPVEIASLARACGGILVAAETSIEFNRLRERATPEQLVETSEREGKFSSFNLACAAPTPMILRGIRALMYREGANPEQSTLSQYVPDFDQLMRFVSSYRVIKNVLNDFETKTAFPYLTRLRSLTQGGANTESIELAFAEYLAKERRFLDRVSGFQGEMNGILGRDSTGAGPTAEDLDRRLGANSPRVFVQSLAHAA